MALNLNTACGEFAIKDWSAIYCSLVKTCCMKKIIRHLRDYVVTLNKAVFLFASLFTALTIFINYRYGLNKTIYRLDEPWQFAGWYAVFLIAFGFGHIPKAWAAYKKSRHIYFMNKERWSNFMLYEFDEKTFSFVGFMWCFAWCLFFPKENLQ